MEPDIRRLEEQLLRAPTLELWEAARALYKSAAPGAVEPRVVLVYGLALVLCFAPGEIRFEKGQSLLRQVARRFEGQGQFGEAALARLYLARAERRRNAAEPELQMLREGFALAQWAGDNPLVARALHEMGMALLEAGRIEEAETTLQDLEACTDRLSTQERWRWHHLRARILLHVGDLRLAARELSRARAALEGPEPSLWLDLLLEDARRLKDALERMHEPQVS
jgi:tetratricopeptide (TPR) repeat protein